MIATKYDTPEEAYRNAQYLNEETDFFHEVVLIYPEQQIHTVIR